MIETRPTTVNTRSSSEYTAQSSTGSIPVTDMAALRQLSKELNLLLSSNPEEEVVMASNSKSEPEEPETISLRAAMANMMLSVEMNKVDLAVSQSDRTNSSLNINDGLVKQITNDYDKLLKMIKENAESSGIMKVFKKISKAFNSLGVAGQIILSLAMVATMSWTAIALAVVLTLASSIPVQGQKTIMDLANEGMTQGFIAIGIPKQWAQFMANTAQVILVIYASKKAGGKDSGTMLAAMMGTGQIVSTQITTSFINAIHKDAPTWVKMTAEIAVVVLALIASFKIGMSNTASKADDTANVAKTASTTATGVSTTTTTTTASTTAWGRFTKSITDELNTADNLEALRFAQQMAMYGIIAAGVGEAISNISLGVMQIEAGKAREKLAAVMGEMEKYKFAQELNENDIPMTSDHISGLLEGLNTDFSDFGRVYGDLARVLKSA